MLRLINRQLISKQVRFNSTSSAAKAQNAVSKVVTKSTELANCAVYWSKVTLELGKYIWTKEALSPPTTQQIQKVFTQDLLSYVQCARTTFAKPQMLIDRVSGLDKQKVLKGSAIAVQLLGLFSLGEIIGRRHIYGYKSHGAHH